MTNTFDWAGLAGSVVLANAGRGPDAAIAILQREIKAAFVPYATHDKWMTWANAGVLHATARAEAAEARVKVLEEALRKAHDKLHECTAVLTASDCADVAACMADIRATLGAEHEK